ncbi:hypothetical protein ACFL6C_04025 [Myxococcota bacterium]
MTANDNKTGFSEPEVIFAGQDPRPGEEPWFIDEIDIHRLLPRAPALTLSRHPYPCRFTTVSEGDDE